MIWLPILASLAVLAWAVRSFVWRFLFGGRPIMSIIWAALAILAVWTAWANVRACAQPVQCLPLEAFVVQQVEPVRAAGIPIITLTNSWEVGRYLEVVNRQPPETDLKAEGLIIGVAGNVVVVALVERGHVCSVIQLAIGVHSDALLAAKRGA